MFCWAMLWAMFCRSPVIPVEGTLMCDTYCNVVADNIHLFMATVFLKSVPSVSGILGPVTLHELFRNGLRNLT